jgi:hypothetical protein
MKKSVIIFVVAVLSVISLIVWLLNSLTSGHLSEIIALAIIIIVGGFSIFQGIGRFKSLIRKEPLEDEFSRNITTNASSLSYYISIYLWLFIMLISDKISLATHTLIGAGILGMALIFALSWLGIRLFGLKNE